MFEKETDLEQLIINDISVIEEGMPFIGNQIKIENGIIDILARDKNNILCIIELKIVTDCKDIIWQSSYYPTCFNEPNRMITIAPEYENHIYFGLQNIKNVEIMNYDIHKNILTIKPYIHNKERKESTKNRIIDILNKEVVYNNCRYTTINIILHKLEIKDSRTIKKYLIELFEKGVFHLEEISEVNNINLISKNDVICYSLLS